MGPSRATDVVEPSPAERRGGAASSASFAAEDRACVAGLRRCDEVVFTQLVERYHGQLLRLARRYVRDREVALEVVQDTWISLIRGIDRFEGRSSLRTWLFRILTNTAKKRGMQEYRSVPFSTLAARGGVGEDGDGVRDADRFSPEGGSWTGHWAIAPGSRGAAPMEHLLAEESRLLIENAISELPALQRTVITLRDIAGRSSAEVRELIELSDVNQRVVLHRARARVRAALDGYLSHTDA